MKINAKVQEPVERVSSHIKEPLERISAEVSLKGGADGTKDYNKLKNKPKINSVELIDDHDGAYYGLTDLLIFDTFVKSQGEKDTLQDQSINSNKTNIERLQLDLNEYKETISKEQQTQDKALEDFKDYQSKKDIEQDQKIQSNKDKFGEYDTTIVVDNKLSGKVDKIDYKSKQEEQDKLISKNTSDISLLNESQKKQDKDFNDYKVSNDAAQKVQDENIQNNALGLLDKVNKKDYEAAELAQNALIESNKLAIAETNKTLETYKQETTKGFQDERELSRKEYEELENLANTKAVIDDLNISPDTTMSSYEMTSRVTCERTFKGNKVDFEPVDGYPILVVAKIKTEVNGDISGWTNVDITQDNGGTHKVYNQEFGKTVYGGTYEPHKGKLTITMDGKYFNGSEKGWAEVLIPNGRKHMFVLANEITNSSNDTTIQLCNDFKTNPPTKPATDFDGVWVEDNKLYIGGGIAQNYNTLQDWLTYLNNNNIQIVYGLSKAVIEEYPPQLIKAESGKNSMYANSGNIEITTHVMPLCDGDITVDVTKKYVDEQDNKIISMFNNYDTSEEVNGKLLLKQDKLSDKQIEDINKIDTLATNDSVTTGDAKLQGQINSLNTALGKTQEKLTDQQLANIEDVPNKASTSYVNRELAKKQTAIEANTSSLETKVDKVTGKGLSTNDLTNELKAKYDKAQENVIESFTLNGTLVTPQGKNVAITVITSGEVDTKIAQAVAKIPTLQFKVVNELPTAGENGIIYLVPIGVPSENNGYTEWAWINAKWEILGTTQVDLREYFKYSDIVDTTGQETKKVMSQKAVTDELANKVDIETFTTELSKKANDVDLPTKLSELQNDTDFATNASVDTKDEATLKSAKDYTDSVAKGGVGKDYVDKQDKALQTQITANTNSLANKQDSLTQDQLTNIAAVPSKADKSELSKKQDALSTEQLNAIADVKNKANTSDLDKKQNKLTEQQLANIDLVPSKANASDIPTNNNQLTNGAGYVTRSEVINDTTIQATSAYSSKKLEDILVSPQYTTLKVNVHKIGSSDYRADVNDNDIRNYFNAGGDVVLRYEDQEFAFDKYLTGVGAVFNYNEINKDLAQRIKIVVKFDKSVEVTNEKLLKVSEAENALKLNNIPANDFAMLVDIANMVEEPTEVALNANTTLIKGWYKTNGDTSNIPTELADKTGFLRVLEFDHDTRSGIQVLYNVNGTIYLREIKNAQPQGWKLIPNESEISKYLPLAGGQMTGAITLGSGDGNGIVFKDRTSNISIFEDGIPKTLVGFYDNKFMIGHPSTQTEIRGLKDLEISGSNAPINLKSVSTNTDYAEIGVGTGRTLFIQPSANNGYVNIGGTPSTTSAQPSNAKLMVEGDINANGKIKENGVSITKYVDDSIQKAILDSWKGAY